VRRRLRFCDHQLSVSRDTGDVIVFGL